MTAHLNHINRTDQAAGDQSGDIGVLACVTAPRAGRWVASDGTAARHDTKETAMTAHINPTDPTAADSSEWVNRQDWFVQWHADAATGSNMWRSRPAELESLLDHVHNAASLAVMERAEREYLASMAIEEQLDSDVDDEQWDSGPVDDLRAATDPAATEWELLTWSNLAAWAEEVETVMEAVPVLLEHLAARCEVDFTTADLLTVVVQPVVDEDVRYEDVYWQSLGLLDPETVLAHNQAFVTEVIDIAGACLHAFLGNC